MLPLTTAAIFLGAGLLFLVQPMVAKQLLPILGGSASVWNTCMLFFQTLLLAGYAYAHGLARIGQRRTQIAVHAALVIAALELLPVGLSPSTGPRAESSPVFWLLGTLAVSIGGPFFVLSATGPLFQHWFAGTRHSHAKDPYFLYAASNAGSLIALCSYPLWLEPSLTLSAQRASWSWGFAVFALLAAVCAYFWLENARPPAQPGTGDATESSEPTPAPSTRLRWIALAFVPSTLMLGVTHHLASDITSFPLLWVVPLAIYLLSFIFAFSRKGGWAVRWAQKLALPTTLVLAMLLAAAVRRPLLPQVVAHLLGLFIFALACHGRLASERPASRHLTSFYMYLALGGMLGGVFNSLVAPRLFDAVIEYPIAIALACWLCIRPTLRHARWEDALLPLLLIAVYAGAPTIGERIGVGSDDGWGLALRYGLAPLVCLAFITRPLRFQLGAVALLVLPYLDFFDRFQVLHQERTFFGVHRVTREPDGSGAWHRLWHGVTTHGMQYDEAPWNEIATTYFALSSPIGDVMGVLAARGGRRHIAVVGLGAGTLASYGRADWDMTFYEIDPAVVRIARNPRLFTFVESSKSPVEMVLGDARQRILTAEAGAYDLIALDAFSSDAVPVHLLTREALQAYLERLAPEGVMTFNVTNWYLDLAPIIAATARDLGLVARLRRDREITDDERRNKKQYSDYVVVARSEADLGPIAGDERWGEIEVPARLRVWNDDYSNILSALRSD